ncbi:MAG: 50S ribosomal protein L2 [Verrucomicrobiota bacterium]|jgi:large subunit ribosomal protein L2|nr:50S ribosomal protein L2 [Verrucomicrobiota bacterium]
MGLKTFKPRSAGLRHRVAPTFDEITEVKPVRRLTEATRSKAGRNNQGRITTRHRGGGVKRRYRIVDFRRDKLGIPARVEAIAYDPNRSANLALLKYVDGEKRYILAPQGLKVDDAVMAGPEAEPSVGNSLPLSLIPLGLYVHNIELVPGQGGKIARSAGNSCQVMARDGDFVTLRLPSGEIRRILAKCAATVGQVGNGDWGSVKLGKAGRKRWLGIRPTVRGVAMNPVDHPMGGGEGRTSGGSHPRSPWGKLAKGGKTRNRRKTSSRFIVKRRK